MPLPTAKQASATTVWAAKQARASASAAVAAATTSASSALTAGAASARQLADRVLSELTERFENDGGGASLAQRLLSTAAFPDSELEAILSLARATYELDVAATPFLLAAEDIPANLRCLGALRGASVELAFRGSTTSGSEGERKLDNWVKVNARARPVPLDPLLVGGAPSLSDDEAPGLALLLSAARVHRGFQQAYLRLRPALLGWLEATGGTISMVVGHSLGGAMATLCALDINLRGRGGAAALRTATPLTSTHHDQ
ncbi:hypothetical protein AB1Y20_021528 [Prymnesium parvum]|uniref:Fungal lipase-type domain-containing protein n=1 Tax=Prymnesium parvum TaxID=97485 RepID=A0AB34JKV5_PRYPA